MNNDKIKFAVVGVGHIGKRHAEVINTNEQAELTAIVDTDRTKIDQAKKIYNVPGFYSIEELLSSETSIDVVNICTPNGLHASQTILSLSKNLHVICEKPLSLNTIDSKKIHSIAQSVNKNVYCVMQNRFSPSAQWLKKIINDKTLGVINMVVVNCFWNRGEDYYNSSPWRGSKEMDGGTLFTQFSHFIDTVYWLFGDIKNIQARFKNFNHDKLIEFEDSAIIQFDFVKGGSCSFNYTTSIWNKNFESSITILGEHGAVKVGGQYMNEVEYCHIKNYEMPILEAGKPANDYGTYKGSAANHEFVIKNVIDHLQGKNKIFVEVEEGIKVVEIIERIYNCNNVAKNLNELVGF